MRRRSGHDSRLTLRLGGLMLGVMSVSCAGRSAKTPRPGPAARVEDAATLPAFETKAPGAPDASSAEVGGPERFHVELRDAPTRGSDDAPVTIVMFSDFECPFCLQGHETLERLRARYGADLRIAYKAFPLDMHPSALAAAMAARSAQAQGRFWEFHDQLFSGESLDLEQLLEYAHAAGLDLDRLVADLESLEYGPAVTRDLRQGRRLGVSSTPTFFVNGRLLKGAKPFSTFTEVVDDELARAEQWRAEGVADADVYQHAIADGYRRVEYSGGRRGLDPDSVLVVPIGDSPALGPAQAPVTIVAFEDFECPFCARGHDTIRELMLAYPEQIRLVFKHNPLPFHSHAFLAARAALVAQRQGRFWEFHDALYARRARFDEDELVAIADEVGLDRREFFRGMNSAELDRRIEADLDLATMLGVSGTPAYFVNGRPVEGALPLLYFRLLVEEELDRAAGVLEQGIEASELYDALMRAPLD